LKPFLTLGLWFLIGEASMSSNKLYESELSTGFVSTGHLPDHEIVRNLVNEAHSRFRSNVEGANSAVYSALARVPSNLFGICVVGTSGDLHTVGDAEYESTIMSVPKPFIYALVCSAFGYKAMRDKVGVNATGLPFNSLAGIEQGSESRTNPMVNAGAIATTSLVPGDTFKSK